MQLLKIYEISTFFKWKYKKLFSLHFPRKSWEKNVRKSSTQYLIQLLQTESKDMQDERVDKLNFRQQEYYLLEFGQLNCWLVFNHSFCFRGFMWRKTLPGRYPLGAAIMGGCHVVEHPQCLSFITMGQPSIPWMPACSKQRTATLSGVLTKLRRDPV